MDGKEEKREDRERASQIFRLRTTPANVTAALRAFQLKYWIIGDKLPPYGAKHIRLLLLFLYPR